MAPYKGQSTQRHEAVAKNESVVNSVNVGHGYAESLHCGMMETRECGRRQAQLCRLVSCGLEHRNVLAH